MYELRYDIDYSEYIDEIAKKVQHRVDQAALDKAAGTLAEYGYVKVVRCRDCKRFDSKTDGCWWFSHYEQQGDYS